LKLISYGIDDASYHDKQKGQNPNIEFKEEKLEELSACEKYAIFLPNIKCTAL
jgi:hypothetical protein